MGSWRVQSTSKYFSQRPFETPWDVNSEGELALARGLRDDKISADSAPEDYGLDPLTLLPGTHLHRDAGDMDVTVGPTSGPSSPAIATACRSTQRLP